MFNLANLIFYCKMNILSEFAVLSKDPSNTELLQQYLPCYGIIGTVGPGAGGRA